MANYSCPICGSEGKKVTSKTVINLVKNDKVEADNYLACLNTDCQIIYFSNANSYNISDLDVQVWFKNSSDQNCPICYCSKLTRKEIKDAVEKGYTTIREIREHTNKTQTGNCLTENPLGNCCHKALDDEIQKYK